MKRLRGAASSEADAAISCVDAVSSVEAERSLTLIVCAVGIVVDTPARCVDRRRDGYVCGSDRRLAQGSLLGASRHTHAQLEDPHSEGCATAKRGYGLAGGRESGCGREWEASWWTAYQD